MLESHDDTASSHPYDRLTPDLVLDAVEHLGYRSDARIMPLNSYENRVYQVGIEDDTPVIVKFYRPQRWSRAQILEEHQFSQDLAERDISVVPPLVDSGGQTLFEYADFMFAIYPRRGGRAPDLDNPDNLVILGRTLGRMHAAGSARKFDHRPDLTIEDFGRKSVEFLLQQNFLPSELAHPYETLARDLIDKIEQQFSHVSINNIRLHGDCHPGNILWRDNVPHFVDFDDARNGPAIQDLWMLLNGERAERNGQLAEIMDGYREFCDFNPQELVLIEPLRTLRLMHYAAWLARRWQDPTFPLNFPWFNTERYWAEHILELREQLALLDEPPLQIV